MGACTGEPSVGKGGDASRRDVPRRDLACLGGPGFFCRARARNAGKKRDADHLPTPITTVAILSPFAGLFLLRANGLSVKRVPSGPCFGSWGGLGSPKPRPRGSGRGAQPRGSCRLAGGGLGARQAAGPEGRLRPPGLGGGGSDPAAGHEGFREHTDQAQPGEARQWHSSRSLQHHVPRLSTVGGSLRAPLMLSGSLGPTDGRAADVAGKPQRRGGAEAAAGPAGPVAAPEADGCQPEQSPGGAAEPAGLQQESRAAGGVDQAQGVGCGEHGLGRGDSLAGPPPSHTLPWPRRRSPPWQPSCRKAQTRSSSPDASST